jgi:hypothetical protein
VLTLPDVSAPPRPSSAKPPVYLPEEKSLLMGDPESTQLIAVSIPDVYAHIYEPPKRLPVVRQDLRRGRATRW